MLIGKARRFHSTNWHRSSPLARSTRFFPTTSSAWLSGRSRHIRCLVPAARLPLSAPVPGPLGHFLSIQIFYNRTRLGLTVALPLQRDGIGRAREANSTVVTFGA